MEHGIVGRIGDGIFRYQGWPTVCRDERGVLYAASSGYRLGHVCPCGKNIMFVSEDEGKSWTSPIVINDTVLDDRDAGIVSLGNGKMLLSWFNHPMEFYEERYYDVEHFVPAAKLPIARACIDYWKQLGEKENHKGSFVKLSNDYGRTWGKAIKVPATSPHGPIKLSDGKLIWIGREFHSEYPTDAILVMESADDGETWQVISEIEQPEQYKGALFCEPDVAELPDGRLIGAIRVQGKPVPFGFTIFTCFSDDRGKTWTTPECLGISGSPPHLFVHSSGALVMTYARRQDPPRICARLSYDGGKTFGEEIALNPSVTSDNGYPSTVELSDGTMLTAYYQRLPEDDFCSILYTKWRIDEA